MPCQFATGSFSANTKERNAKGTITTLGFKRAGNKGNTKHARKVLFIYFFQN